MSNPVQSEQLTFLSESMPADIKSAVQEVAAAMDLLIDQHQAVWSLLVRDLLPDADPTIDVNRCQWLKSIPTPANFIEAIRSFLQLNTAVKRSAKNMMLAVLFFSLSTQERIQLATWVKRNEDLEMEDRERCPVSRLSKATSLNFLGYLYSGRFLVNIKFVYTMFRCSLSENPTVQDTVSEAGSE